MNLLRSPGFATPGAAPAGRWLGLIGILLAACLALGWFLARAEPASLQGVLLLLGCVGTICAASGAPRRWTARTALVAVPLAAEIAAAVLLQARQNALAALVIGASLVILSPLVISATVRPLASLAVAAQAAALLAVVATPLLLIGAGFSPRAERALLVGLLSPVLVGYLLAAGFEVPYALLGAAICAGQAGIGLFELGVALDRPALRLAAVALGAIFAVLVGAATAFIWGARRGPKSRSVAPR